MPPTTTPPPSIPNNSSNFFAGQPKSIGINVPIGMANNLYINPVSNSYPTTMPGFEHPVFDPRAGTYYPVPNAPGYEHRVPSGYSSGYIPNMGAHPVYPPRMVTQPIPRYQPTQYEAPNAFYPGRGPVNPAVAHLSARQV
jgi:hypothetical protein